MGGLSYLIGKLTIIKTISKARDLGNGFAVVANEIKELSKQTANATAEIEELVERTSSQIQAVVGNFNSGSKED